jgi:isopentenyl diphosphate isomerase/L-lactate dehydrogenase-like FMN-dependent dehydrogenase
MTAPRGDQPSSEAASIAVRRQMAIYARGLEGERPAIPVSAEKLEEAAKGVLKLEAYCYVAGGAGGEATMRANRNGFDRWRIVPRMLRDVSRRDCGVKLFGKALTQPLLLAPVGVQSLFHPDAELAVARAARSLNVPIVLSSAASKPMEAVAEAMGDVTRWFQLYWPKNKELAASFLSRAEKAGYSAIVVTLDTHMLGWRERDLQRAYLPFLYGQGLANYFTDPVFRAALPAPPERDPRPAIQYFLEIFSDPSLTWVDLGFLRQHTKLPILLKGILDPEDARMAMDHGVDGIIVSNHGGRQVDGAIGAIEALPRVAREIGDRIPVLFDSGIRRGADVFKALALGARAVLLGRPYCYGLAIGGEEGVRTVVENLLADIELTLGLAGCASIGDVSIDRLVEAP